MPTPDKILLRKIRKREKRKLKLTSQKTDSNPEPEKDIEALNNEKEAKKRVVQDGDTNGKVPKKKLKKVKEELKEEPLEVKSEEESSDDSQDEQDTKEDDSEKKIEQRFTWIKPLLRYTIRSKIHCTGRHSVRTNSFRN